MIESFNSGTDFDVYLENKKNIERFGVFKVNPEFDWADKKPEWKCRKCGRIFRCSIKSMAKLPGCRMCAKENLSSLGEEEVCYLLEEKGIRYERQKFFYDMPLGLYKGVLKYDFYIEGKGGKWFLLEVDGAYHFRNEDEDPTNRQDIVLCRIHDSMKNEYASNKGITLYRIVYDCVQENLERSLMEILGKEGLLG